MRQFLWLLVPVFCSARGIDHIQAVSNPHDSVISESGTCMIGDNDGCPILGNLDVSKVASDPIGTQSDTFLGLDRKIVRGQEV